MRNYRRGRNSHTGGTRDARAGDAYIEKTRDEHVANVLVRVRPERWLTVDYARE